MMMTVKTMMEHSLDNPLTLKNLQVFFRLSSVRAGFIKLERYVWYFGLHNCKQKKNKNYTNHYKFKILSI